VLYFTGTDGAIDPWAAALLASHGFPTLALAYFNQPGLPPTLTNVPIEYFGTAAKVLSEQPGVANRHVIVGGFSRGTEAALLAAQNYPALVRGVLLYAPNYVAGAGYPVGNNAWTLGGKPVPRLAIPVDRIAGQVLAVAGGKDAVWPSLAQSEQLMQLLVDAGDRSAHRTLEYPAAGHIVGSYPYTPQGTRSLTNKVIGDDDWSGGDPAVNAAARADGWPKVLAFLKSVS
jgi:dienelactone hydrolase